MSRCFQLTTFTKKLIQFERYTLVNPNIRKIEWYWRFKIQMLIKACMNDVWTKLHANTIFHVYIIPQVIRCHIVGSIHIMLKRFNLSILDDEFIWTDSDSGSLTRLLIWHFIWSLFLSHFMHHVIKTITYSYTCL